MLTPLLEKKTVLVFLPAPIYYNIPKCNAGD